MSGLALLIAAVWRFASRLRGRRCQAAASAGFAMVAMALAPLPASAHEISLVDLKLREVAAGQFVWSWGQPGKNRPVADDLTVRWPEGCVADARTVQCGPKGLAGELRVNGLGDSYSAAILQVVWRGGEETVRTLTASQPAQRLFGSASDNRDRSEVAEAYGVLGVQHILTGWDHLLFVGALLWLVGFQRRLVWTITAFTVAHSITVAAAALGWMTLRPPPVEAVIALSIVIVCAEALKPGESLARRFPALLAFVFGLVHGLGFAGALKDFGLPANHQWVALLTFNLGVEAAQLMAVGLVWAATVVVSRVMPGSGLRRPVIYGMGATASYWLWMRLVTLAA